MEVPEDTSVYRREVESLVNNGYPLEVAEEMAAVIVEGGDVVDDRVKDGTLKR